jgi:hypothetical protein
MCQVTELNIGLRGEWPTFEKNHGCDHRSHRSKKAHCQSNAKANHDPLKSCGELSIANSRTSSDTHGIYPTK